VLNQVPIQRALNRLPVKVFAIQLYSALSVAKVFDKQSQLLNVSKHGIPVLVLKSTNDPIARFVPRFYENNPHVQIIDITNHDEQELFREHLYHMTEPRLTTAIIDRFITETEANRN
jgi:hypothetical protein